MTEVVEHLPSKDKTVSSKPQYHHKNTVSHDFPLCPWMRPVLILPSTSCPSDLYLGLTTVPADFLVPPFICSLDSLAGKKARGRYG
jgi:hypothetical protein